MEVSNKIKDMNERTELENIILDLEKLSQQDDEASSKIAELKLRVEALLDRSITDDHKLYLSEIIELEKPEFGSNNLILAPVGSGKSALIENKLLEDEEGKVLMLVSNRYLKDDICPNDNVIRKERAERGFSKMMFTSKNREKFGDEKYEVHVMTYSELGLKIRDNDNFLDNVTQIYCDEIHSLPEYKNMSKSEHLAHAVKYLFNAQEGKKIFYFTATDDNLRELEKTRPALFKDITKFDYRNHDLIKKYMELSKYEFHHIEQIRPHLKARLESFNYFKHKGLAFSRTIRGQKYIEEILIEEGYKPLLLWSDSNDDFPLTNEQIKAREELIKTNEIPAPYNFLVINSAMREGWDLKDRKIKLAIMNTTNRTDFIQARGRIRKDIDILLYKTTVGKTDDVKIDAPEEYLGIPLTKSRKDELCEKLNVVNDRGELLKWTTVKKMLFKNGYNVVDTEKTINKKRTRVSIISL